MDNKVRNTYLAMGMFMTHSTVVNPGVIEYVNNVAKEDGFQIPSDVAFSMDDKREIVLTAAETVYLGRRQGTATELERIVQLVIVNGAVQLGFLTPASAFAVMNTLTGTKPKHINEYTEENWRSSLDSIVKMSWPKVEHQLHDLEVKASRNAERFGVERLDELASQRAFWREPHMRQLDYVETAKNPTFNDALAIYMTAGHLAWQYMIEILYTRHLH